MAVDVFNNPTKQMPKDDPQIVRVNMEQLDIGGRKSHLPREDKSPDMAIKHVQNG